MPPNSSSAALRTALEDSFSGWLDEVETLLVGAREQGRMELAESLNQAARRLRKSGSFDELAGTLTDAASAFAQGTAVLRVEDGKATGVRVRGVDAEREERFRGLEIPFSEAGALAGAAETDDPVTAIGTATQVSAALLEIAGHADNEKVWIFPVTRDGRARGLLYCWGEVDGANLELLAQMAGLCLEPPPPPVPALPLLNIAPAPAMPPQEPTAEPPQAPAAVVHREWEELSPDEQAIHLSAQRFARVRVAEIRLHQAEAVHAGRMHRDLYGTLQEPIDRARANFRRMYIDVCPSMVDYLHLELVRTLAHDNPRLLGDDYPGALS